MPIDRDQLITRLRTEIRLTRGRRNQLLRKIISKPEGFEAKNKAVLMTKINNQIADLEKRYGKLKAN